MVRINAATVGFDFYICVYELKIEHSAKNKFSNLVTFEKFVNVRYINISLKVMTIPRNYVQHSKTTA